MEKNKLKYDQHSDIVNLKNVYINPSIEDISEHIILNREGKIGMNGSMMVDTVSLQEGHLKINIL